MRTLLILILISSLTACGSSYHRYKAAVTTSVTAELRDRVELYTRLAPRGWEADRSGDALLFVSLQSVGLDSESPLDEAQGLEPGRWYRSPECRLDSSTCGSDISRDMFMGLLTYANHFHRLDIAEGIWSYGHAHQWAMGAERQGPNDRTVLTPQLIGLLARVIYHLGGTNHPERLIGSIYNTPPGFESHLTMLQIALEGEMAGSLTDAQLAALRAIRVHMSINPLVHALLHKYTDGDQSEATRLLLTIWPADRLPTSSDWTETWRLQRSDGDSGFLPGAPGLVHSGGDFLFAAGIILR